MEYKQQQADGVLEGENIKVMARGCAYSYNCSLTTSPSIFLPAMPLWLQPSEHLFHSLVIALLWKKKSKQAKLFLRTGMNSASQLHLQMTGAAEGKEGRKFGSNRSPLLKSQHRRRFTCTKVPKTAKMYLGSICRAGRRAGRASLGQCLQQEQVPTVQELCPMVLCSTQKVSISPSISCIL